MGRKAYLLCSAAGRGKTTAAISRILKLRARRQFDPVWVLLPIQTQIAPFRERLIEEAAAQSIPFVAVAGIDYFNFPALNSWLLEIFGLPQRRINDPARFAILRSVIEGHYSELVHFSTIALYPGFVRVAAEFIEELKSSLITPEAFQQAAFSNKDRDLAIIYAGYQEFLIKQRLVDREGEAWLALERIQAAINDQAADRALSLVLQNAFPKQLVIDGFDQFSHVQIQIINGLGVLLDQVALTFTYQSSRADTAHRRFARTRHELLLDAARPQYGGLEWVDDPINAPLSNRPDVLQKLAETLFESSLPAVTLPAVTLTAGQSQRAVTMIEAPDRRRELHAVLRQIKTLLLEGSDPNQILIVAHDPSAYLRYLNADGLQQGVPVLVARGLPLAESPMTIALTALLELHSTDFLRRRVLDTLRNPYIDCPYLNSDQVIALDTISQQRQVVRGRENWLSAVATAIQHAQAAPLRDPDDPEPRESGLNSALLPGLDIALETAFAAITPPATASARDYVAWIEQLIGHDAHADQDVAIADQAIPDDTDADHVNDADPVQSSTELSVTESLITEAVKPDWGILSGVHHGRDSLPVVVSRDIAALQCLKRTLRDLLNAGALLSDPIVTWADFYRDLSIAITNTRIDIGDLHARAGSVLFTDVYKARGVSHQHVFILDLSEGQFPVRATEDPLYLDSERVAMTAQHGFNLRTRAEQADEASLFYEMVCLARTTLTLSRPYIDDKGEEWQASPYWRAVREKLSDVTVERISISPALTLEATATSSDLMSAMVATLNNPLSPTEQLPDRLKVVDQWLSTSAVAGQWAHIRRTRRIEVARRTDPTPTPYSGQIEAADLLESISVRLGASHLWSASQFSDYGLCPYRFFAHRILKLSEWEEVEEGLDVRQIGMIQHEILQATYDDVMALGAKIDASGQATALERLQHHSQQVLDRAPATIGFHPGRLWEQERLQIEKKLIRFVTADFSADSPLIKPFSTDQSARYPYAMERDFGADDPLPLDDSEGQPLNVIGAIDRVDSIDGHLYIYDYKSGSSSISAQDMISNRNVQMLIYIRAAQHLWPDHTVSGSAFVQLGSLKTSGAVVIDGDTLSANPAASTTTSAATQTELDKALTQLRENAAAARHGQYPTRPHGEKLSADICSSYCTFYTLCRAKTMA